MTKQLRWGFLGAGGIAPVIAADFQVAGLKIQAVGTRNIAGANAFADRFDVPNRHEGYDGLVNDPEVDIVYVSTIHPKHAEHALLAINAGKHVLVEKPFALNAAEAKAVRDAARAKGVFVMEAMWTRFLPSMTELFRIINSGQLGEITLVTADHSQYLPESFAPRLWKPELGGGALLDLGIYPVSFFSRLFGKHASVNAVATLTPDGIDQTTSAAFKYANGAQASMTTTMTAFGSIGATVVGTKGRVDLATSFYEQTSLKVYETDMSRESEVQKEVSKYEAKIDGRGMQYQAIEVERCVTAGLTESPLMTLDETVSIMETMDEIRKQTGVKYPGE
jgi:predicted dehydrogenase